MAGRGWDPRSGPPSAPWQSSHHPRHQQQHHQHRAPGPPPPPPPLGAGYTHPADAMMAESAHRPRREGGHDLRHSDRRRSPPQRRPRSRSPPPPRWAPEHAGRPWQRGRERSRSRERGRDRDRDRDRDRGRERDWEGAGRAAAPTTVVKVNGLAPTVTEAELAAAFGDVAAELKDLRLIRDHNTGECRGFAFAEFMTLGEARRFVDGTGKVWLRGERLPLQYSSQARSSASIDSDDWLCEKCGTQNFRRRAECYSCQAPRTRASQTVARASLSSREGKTASSAELLIRGLDINTTRETVEHAIGQLAGTRAPLSVRVKKDKLQVGRICFVAFATAEDAQAVMHAIDSSGKQLKIDFKPVFVSYSFGGGPPQRARPTNKMASEAIEAAMALATPMTAAHNPFLAGLPQEIKSRLVYDESSGYFYDASTGFYYDHSTESFYDGTTGSHLAWNTQTHTYDKLTGKRLAAAKARTEERRAEALNPAAAEPESAATTKQTAPASAAAGGGGGGGGGAGTGTADANPPPPKEKDAKQIEKDLQRWQKKQQKEQQRQQKQAEVKRREAEALKKARAAKALADDLANDARPEMLGDWNKDEDNPFQTNLPPFLLEHFDDWYSAIDSGHVDLERNACMLCKRGLGNAEKLEKHVRVSKLHIENRNQERERIKSALTEQQLEELSELARNTRYRDRAAERRKKFNQPERVVIMSRKRYNSMQVQEVPSYVEQPTVDGIKEDNLGNQMLQRMGWKAGEGLGRNKQGITAPVEAEVRMAGAGIGAAGKAPTYVKSRPHLAKTIARYNSGV